MSDTPNRKRLRLEYWDYSDPGAYFITICTQDKKPLLGSVQMNGDEAEVHLTASGVIAEKALLKMPGIDQFIVMPNHIHFIVILDEGSKADGRSLPQIVRAYKYAVSKEIGESIWQRSYYEHVIRNRRDYLSHVRYILENPVRWVYDKY